MNIKLVQASRADSGCEIKWAWQGLNRLRKNSESRVKWKDGVPQGLKPTFIFSYLRHDSSHALTPLAAPDEFFRSLSSPP
jgi:hypothetical protein